MVRPALDATAAPAPADACFVCKIFGVPEDIQHQLHGDAPAAGASVTS
jgi:hypothetical protein